VHCAYLAFILIPRQWRRLVAAGLAADKIFKSLGVSNNFCQNRRKNCISKIFCFVFLFDYSGNIYKPGPAADRGSTEL